MKHGNKIGTTILVVSLSGLLFGFVPRVNGQQISATGSVEYGCFVESDSVYNLTIHPTGISFLSFGDSMSGFTITWGNDGLEILYGKGTTPSEAARQFFKWLKKYIKTEYYLIKKQNINEILQGAKSK